MSMLEAALWYHKQGFSVIPAKKDKKPFVKWTPYQEKAADEVQIREWWDKWPNANIGLVTGKVSGITVLDADSQAGKDSVEEFLSDSIMLPTVKTPNGWHFYFKHTPGLSNGVRVLNDCDIRTDRGYVVAPPSKNGAATSYVWIEGLHIKDNPPVVMPSMAKETIEQQCYSSNLKTNSLNVTNSLLYTSQNDRGQNGQTWTNVDILSQGSRDDTLFTLANHLVKGNMQIDKIRFFLSFFASHCDPPFPEKEIEIKIKSALDRANTRDINVAEIVREWVMSTRGHFLSTECRNMSMLSTRKELKAMSAVLARMVDEGIIERVGSKNGHFRKIEKELNLMDIYNVSSDYLDIKYPLDLHELFRTMPRNIIVIAGTPNVGKTAFMLNMVTMNMNKGMDIRYFTSEMGEFELSQRCKMFEPEIPLSFWKNVKFCDHSSGFGDKVDPNGLNIIDFLEIPDQFWLVGEKLKEIYDKLDKGVAVVALQKKYGQKLGRGAEFSLEKPRLYVTLESNPPEGNVAVIEKCKNHARGDINPNHMECVFNVIQGVKIRQQLNWSHPSPKGEK